MLKRKDLMANAHVSWFGQGGEDGDIVLFSAVNLARNYRDLPFPIQADEDEMQVAFDRTKDFIDEAGKAMGTKFSFWDADELQEWERSGLAEKRLAGHAFCESDCPSASMIAEEQDLAIFINEEDHLNFIALQTGLAPRDVYQRASDLEDVIEAKEDFAFSERMGYLTSEPSRTGTGLRASVALHLPGLVLSGNIGHVTRATQKLGLSMEGLFGDNASEAGHMYVVENQATLGFSEAEILKNLEAAANEIIEQERRARNALSLYDKTRLEDDCYRTLGILRYARSLTEDEVHKYLSKLRLGVDMELVPEIDPLFFAEAVLGTRERLVAARAEKDRLRNDPPMNRERAEYVRCLLCEGGRFCFS